MVSVVAGVADAARAQSWGASYRIGSDEDWFACRLLDISLDGASIELAGDVPDGPCEELPFVVQIESIAEDEVGVSVPATIERVDRDSRGSVVVDVAFSARREERMLLHLLVRLHELV